jgi:dolichol-phosphate mannosyltransferase
MREFVKHISVVVPVYCNAGSLPELHSRLSAVALLTNCIFEFIFVDDGSFDNSYEVLQQIASSDHRVIVIKLSRNFGSNMALTAGLNYAKGDGVVMIAADLQDPPEIITEMLPHWLSRTKVVLAARRSRNDPFMTRLAASLFNKLFRKFVFKDFPENGFDCVLIDRQVVDVVLNCSEKNTHLFGLIMWAGFKSTVVHYDRLERRHGSSMWTFTKKIKYFIDAFTSFSYLPLRVASTLGVFIALCGLIYAVVVVYVGIFTDIKVEGWASLMIALLLTSGTQLVILGVIGEYIWRNLEQTRNRPLFVVDEILENQPKKINSKTSTNLVQGK